jgi:hypothetical protein
MTEAAGAGGKQRRIGVAVSGGGYRAAAWGLGTLLYLADAELNDQVVTVSSVSGGSITNAALGLQPYQRIDAAEMRTLAASMAPQLAGNLWPFLGLLLLHLGAWTTMVVAAGRHAFGLAGIALAAAVALSFVAPVCGDAVFRVRVTWVYCDLLLASVALFAFALGEGWWLAGAVTLVGVILLFRGVVVGWAIGSSLLRQNRATLADLSGDIDHVMCACDLHGRYHVYFGRDFVYSYARGAGARPTLALSAAVQSSANLPGAFAPRAMRSKPFRFAGSRHTSPLLALTDGGVYDNMADEWLLAFSDRVGRLRQAAAKAADSHLRASLEAAADRLEDRSPTFVVVANASGPLGFKFAWTSFIPFLGELLSLLRVKSILYDNGNTTRRRMITDQFLHHEREGIIVHISTDPWSVVADGRAQSDPVIQKRAEAAATELSSTPGLEEQSTSTPAAAGTVLYPLSRGRIAKLLQRSYAIACVQGHVWHGLRLVNIPPLAWFETLEAGRSTEPPR